MFMDIIDKNGKLIFYQGPRVIAGVLVLSLGIGLLIIDGGFFFLFMLQLANSTFPLWANLVWFCIPSIVLTVIFLFGLWIGYSGVRLLIGRESKTFTKEKIFEKAELLWSRHEKTFDLNEYSHIELKLLAVDDYRTGALSRIEIVAKDEKEPIEYPVRDGFEDLELYAEKISEITGLKLLKSKQ